MYNNEWFGVFYLEKKEVNTAKVFYGFFTFNKKNPYRK